MSILVTILAHNEAPRIAACLDSMPLGANGIEVAVVVNGSTDGTAEVVRGYETRGARLVEYAEGGKSRSWNRFILDKAPQADTYVFADGDARFLPGTVEGLAACLETNPRGNAAAGLPRNGRRAAHYRRLLEEKGGLFGDCYALSGSFVRRMREMGIRLPSDLVGDDGLLAALAATDLRCDPEWDESRVLRCREGGFLCEPTPFTKIGLDGQFRRMTNYSVRHFQNRIITAIMQREGPDALPERLAELYPEWLPRFRPRLNPLWFAFDRQALERMRAAAS